MTIHVYIAAPYPIRERAQRLARLCELNGMTITSTWLKEDDALDHESASRGLHDIVRAHVVVALNPVGYENAGTGGRHVELGYALALAIPVILVGERTNIFHHLKHVRVVDDGEDIIKHVRRVLGQP